MGDTILTIEEIKDLIPHRYPFLLIDRVTELEVGKKIVFLKNVTINEPFFQGHFPEFPIMPGVLIIEAMAQGSGVLAKKSSNMDSNTLVYFMGIDKAKFRKPVIPGDQIRFEVEILKQRPPCWKVKGKAFVDDKLVCEAEITAMLHEEK